MNSSIGILGDVDDAGVAFSWETWKSPDSAFALLIVAASIITLVAVLALATFLPVAWLHYPDPGSSSRHALGHLSLRRRAPNLGF